MKKNRKLFKGMSPLIIDSHGKIKEFFTKATTEEQGARSLRYKMNQERGYVPEASLTIDITEIKIITNRP